MENVSDAATNTDSSSVFARVEQYPWDSDQEFQSGLTAILGSSSSPEHAAELTLRARCFYFSRKFSTRIDFDAYKHYRESVGLPPSNGVQGLPPIARPETQGTIVPPSALSASAPEAANASSQQEAPYPTSFAEIVELITSGKPVPGIKEIPPTVLEGQGTNAARPGRKKPWEKDEATIAPTSETA